MVTRPSFRRPDSTLIAVSWPGSPRPGAFGLLSAASAAVRQAASVITNVAAKRGAAPVRDRMVGSCSNVPSSHFAPSSWRERTCVRLSCRAGKIASNRLVASRGEAAFASPHPDFYRIARPPCRCSSHSAGILRVYLDYEPIACVLNPHLVLTGKGGNRRGG